MSIETLTSTHQILMEQEVVDNGPAMGRNKKFVQVGDWMSCRIVPYRAGEERFDFNVQSFRFTHTLYFSFDPQADERMRFKDEEGNQYYFLKSKNPDKLNRFFKVYVDLHTGRPKVD